MARKRKKLQSKKNSYAIVVEGETEVWYFNMLKRNERNLIVKIEPEIPQSQELNEQFNRVKELVEYYDMVFWIIDLDKIIKETRETAKNKQPKIRELQDYFVKLKNYNNVVKIINNPCLEFWFLLHFKETSRYFENCSKVINMLKEKLPYYKKSKKYFTKENNDIYKSLKPYLENAIKNAKKLGEIDFENFDNSLSMMYLFFEIDKIKSSLNTD